MMSVVLAVKDAGASLAFYTEKLGYEPFGEALPGPDGQPVFAGVSIDGSMVMFDGTNPQAVDKPALGEGFTLYLNVADDVDIDSYYNQVKAAGVPVVGELQDMFWGDRLFTVTDPDGYKVTIAKQIFDASFDALASVTSQGQSS